MKNLNIKEIIQVPLPKTQYFQEEFSKKQIVIHHTAGADNAKNVINGWANNSERIATPFVIDSKGVIFQAFSSKHWAHHLGTKLATNTKLNKESIAIELTNWGPLKEKEGKFYNYLNKEVPVDQVEKLDKEFKGYNYFHKYTDAQIEGLRQLMVYLGETYNIPLDYNEDMWGLSKNATSGKLGVYTHVSYRTDKSDCYPSPRLITMLKSLK